MNPASTRLGRPLQENVQTISKYTNSSLGIQMGGFVLNSAHPSREGESIYQPLEWGGGRERWWQTERWVDHTETDGEDDEVNEWPVIRDEIITSIYPLHSLPLYAGFHWRTLVVPLYTDFASFNSHPSLLRQPALAPSPAIPCDSIELGWEAASHQITIFGNRAPEL